MDTDVFASKDEIVLLQRWVAEVMAGHTTVMLSVLKELAEQGSLDMSKMIGSLESTLDSMGNESDPVSEQSVALPLIVLLKSLKEADWSKGRIE